MKLHWICPILLMVLLGACTPTTPTTIIATLSPPNTAVPSTEPTQLPTQPPTAAPTLLPAPTATLTLAPTALPTSKPSATALPSATPLLPVVNATLVTPDCARFPNFGPCGTNLNLTGRLALFDTQRQVIQILDFQTKQDLEIKAPTGSRTLLWTNLGNTLVTVNNDNQPALAWTNPILSSLPVLPLRSPLGTSIFTAADGSTAWLDQKDGPVSLHVRTAGAGPEQIWPVEPQASDKLHLLLGWVPGTNLLLGGYHYSGNSMWITGSSLYTIDSRTGAIKDLKASLRLGGSFQWHPTQAGLLLFGNSTSPVIGAPRPSVLDVINGKLTALVADESISSSALSWTRNGQAILLAAKTVGQPAKANTTFAAAGIYQLDWPGGTVKALTKPAAAEQDDWPQLLADGKRFFYIHILGDGKTAELRLGALDGAAMDRVATGLAVNPSAGLTGFQWENLLAYTP